MNDLESLYRQVIMEHYKHPRNKGLVGYESHYHIKNPSCGDDITVEIKLENGLIKDIHHEGTGCAICCSSASVLTELMKGKTVEEAKRLVEKYLTMLRGEEIEDEDELEEASVYKGVSKFPARIKCAAISWKALERLLNGEKDEQ